jgi:Family of unknown function (DUF6230)
MLLKRTRAARKQDRDQDRGGIRWRRFGAMLIASGAITGALVVLTAEGALGVQFSISGIPFTVTADKLTGEGFEQFATLDSMAPGSPNAGTTGGQLVLIVSAIRSATLTNMCQSIALGGEYMKITAGGGSTPVSADTLVVDSSSITGDASFSNMNVGQDASTLNEVPGVTGAKGLFSQQADTVTINNLRQTNYATTAGTFTLPGLSMSFSSTGC